ncbi:putative membrane-associated kinase regulator [Helianthus debilis subsp. tardiflorus]
MEAFSLLRYWRTTTNAAGSNTTTNAHVSTSTTTIVTTQSSETDDDNDHGPFFDLEFSLPPEEEDDDDDDAVDVKQAAAENKVLKNAEAENSDEEEDVDGSDESGDEEEDESELKFTLIDSDSSGDVVNVSVSPSDELFFNGGFVPAEQQQTAEIRSKPFQSQSQPRVLLMKSATKFRVMMLKLKKIKSSETTDSNCSSSKEDAPIVSLFKRHNSSKATKKRENDVVEPVSVSSEEKKFSKEAVHKYLRKVKPLYVRVSNRYGEKLKFTGQLKKSKSEVTEPSPESSATEKESKSESPALKQGNLPAGLGVVCKHLRKSRSAFTAVAAAPAPSNRRDDSLIQQQDGIQSAILHCKRSFKASRDSDCSSSSGSDPVPLLLGKSENSCDAAEGTAEINKR